MSELEYCVKKINGAIKDIKEVEETLNNNDLTLQEVQMYKEVLTNLNNSVSGLIKHLNKRGFTFENEDFRKVS